jgi:hypothetical protein
MRVLDFYVKCPGTVQAFNLYPIGDMQFGAEGVDEALWRRCVSQIKADPSALFIGMGDYGDHWRPTNQAKIAGIRTSDKDFARSMDSMFEGYNQRLFERLAPIVKPGRCLGLLSGHHEFEYSSGINSTQELCRRLNVPYLGRSALIDVVFGSPRRAWILRIHAQHGEGGASYVGSDVPNLERKTMPFWDADLLLRGHSTKVYSFAVPRLTKTKPMRGIRPRLIEKKITCVNTGGFMRGYLEGDDNNPRDTYVSKANMSPAHLGYAVVHINLERHRTDQSGFTSRQIRLSVTT